MAVGWIVLISAVVTHPPEGYWLSPMCQKAQWGSWGIVRDKRVPVPDPRQLTVYKAISIFIVYFMIPNIWIVSYVSEKQKE